MMSKKEQCMTLVHALQSSFEEAVQMEQLKSFLIINRISKEQFENLMKQINRTYVLQYQNVKAYIVLLIISLLNEFTKSIQASLEFLDGLLKGRIALVSANANKITLNQTLKYIKALSHVLVPLILQKQKQQFLIKILLNNNADRDEDSNDFISNIVQIMLIIEIKENLETDSFSQFFEIICQGIDCKSLSRKRIYATLQRVLKQDRIQTDLDLGKLAIIRDSDQSCQILNLRYKNSVLFKQQSKQNLQEWVIKAYRGQFQKVRLSAFKDGNIFELFEFCMKLQVFGSSPMITDLEDHVKNTQFLDVFVKFLMGTNLIEQQYTFGCDNWKSALNFLWQQSQQMSVNLKHNILNEAKRMLIQENSSF